MKRVVILGGGESGVGTAILATQQGFDVFLSDFGKIAAPYSAVLEQHHIAWEEQQHTADLILTADVVVKSPGIPDKAEMVVQIRERGIPVISEIEFAYAYAKQPTIAITGSNGKTTTTLLTAHLLQRGGIAAVVAGNIGDSFAKQIAEDPDAICVLELSSFQLDGIETYRPHIAVVTNLSPDHLDRYHYDYQEYIDAKFRITMNQTAEDYLIYDADDVEIEKWLANHEVKAKKIPFSLTSIQENGAYVSGENIIANSNNEQLIMAINDISLEGKHNVKNAMAATTVAQLMRIRKQTIRESLSDFQAVEHRLEKVLKIKNVQYVNDSKATNINATFYALESMKTPTVWILGGVDKGNDYDELMPLVREKVKSIVCLGVDNEKIKAAYRNVVDVFVETTSMDEAVKIAAKLSEDGDTVLLSPACASFDLFSSYEDRGNQFKQAVHNL
ncbi:UDP-N-acetylmuramoyl-L-alanine--D-glutamate ligase [Flavobacterium sp. JP2137]|uniref:UDP-N-acetylmuramoyl-L-alanine--D-glutamate ligase n=1 Tax=Flavobacterium sp. JP2137 TaxID=3414510 RepID=UPI003D2FF7CD